MSWVKLDQAFPTHPKVLAAGASASWLYVSGLCYSGLHLTDGFISRAVLPNFSTVPRPFLCADRLVSVGLWEVSSDPDGWMIHDYGQYQTAREQVERQRELTAERVRRHRGNADVTPLRVVEVTPPELEEKRTRKEPIAKRRSAAPSELVISTEMKAWATDKGLTKIDLEHETAKMLDHHRAKGSTMLDWTAAWRTWMTRAGEYQPGLVTPNNGTRPKPAEGARIPGKRYCVNCREGWREIEDRGETITIMCECQTSPLGDHQWA